MLGGENEGGVRNESSSEVVRVDYSMRSDYLYTQIDYDVFI